MSVQLGQLSNNLRQYISKRLYIREWDVDSPNVFNTPANLSPDSKVYPANIAVTYPSSSITTEYTYFGTECTADLNLSIRFRFRYSQYKLQDSLPYASLQTLHSYVSSIVPRDSYFISPEIIEMRVVSKGNAIQTSPDSTGSQGQKDWIVTLNFNFTTRFVSYATSGEVPFGQWDTDIIEVPGVMPPPAGQPGGPTGTDDTTPIEPWQIQQLILRLELATQGFTTSSPVAEITINVEEP